MSFLEISDLTSGYGKATILRNLSLSVDRGESVGIVGRNGAGKSTLLLSIFGQTRVFGGEIRVAGTRIDRLPAYRAAHLGVSFSPQGRMILPNLTVQENLCMSLATGRKGDWTLEGVFDLFPVLRERARQPGMALSGGQLQMLAIGRALMANPEVLVLDEPTEGLAPVLVDVLTEALLKVRASGTGILVVEQHHALIRAVTDRFVVMAKGEIRGGGTSAEMAAEENAHLFEL